MDARVEERTLSKPAKEETRPNVHETLCHTYLNLLARILLQGLTPETLPSPEDRDTLTSCLRLKRRDQWLTATVMGGIQVFATYRMRKAKGWFGTQSNKLLAQVVMCVGWLLSVNHAAKRGMDMTVRRCAALPPSSALGNEVRIILAELEGPEGPAWESIGSRWFRENVVGSGGDGFNRGRGWNRDDGDEGEGEEGEGDEGDEIREKRKHPQFLLQPRIWVRKKGGKDDVVPLIRTREDVLRKGMEVALEGQKRRAIEQIERTEDQGEEVTEGKRDTVRVEDTKDEKMEYSKRRRRRMYYDDEEDDIDSFGDEDVQGTRDESIKPFDFGAATLSSGRTNDRHEPDDVPMANTDGTRETRKLTPSQRRAAERARRRREAWERRNEIRESRERSW